MIDVNTLVDRPMIKQYLVTFNDNTDTMIQIDHNLGVNSLKVSLLPINSACYDGKIYVDNISLTSLQIHKLDGVGAGASCILTIEVI